MRLREFMAIFRPLRNDINSYGEEIGYIPVQLAGTIEADVREFTTSVRKKTGDERKGDIQHLDVPGKFLDNLRELMESMPKNVLFVV